MFVSSLCGVTCCFIAVLCYFFDMVLLRYSFKLFYVIHASVAVSVRNIYVVACVGGAIKVHSAF